jgi:phytoene synthase
MEMIQPNVEVANARPAVSAAYAVCRTLATEHYENFPVGSLFAPRRLRPSVHAIYAFARVADDFADEGSLLPEDRLQRLQEWQEQLNACFSGEAVHPVFVALADTVHKLKLPKKPFDDLLEAFRMDVTTHRYKSFDDVLTYCRHSADPVGRLVLRIFGFASEHLDALSDSLCTSLQLTNFWQDLALDLKRGRIYLPLDDLERFGYTVEDLNNRVIDHRFRSMIQFQIERTRSLFASALPLPALVGRRLGMELTLTWRGGMTILRKIEETNYDLFSSRPKITTPDKLRILFGAS